MNKIEHLIISSSLDYSTDYVVLEMKKRNLRYLRINRDQFMNVRLSYSLDNESMVVTVHNELFELSCDELKSVYFRAPVFIRSNKSYSLEEQLERSQWSSFIRNLIIFDKAIWINNPVSTYRTENKMYQLEIAKRCGLKIPETYIANDVMNSIMPNKQYVVKSLDTALFYKGDQEFFTYTTMITGDELNKASIVEAPVIIQEYLEDKVDIRVTCVGDRLYPASVTNGGNGIVGDWRKTPKEQLNYKYWELPNELSEKLLLLMRKLEIVFGGIDLVFSHGEYYFIEVNPTGEWGWLVNTARFPIPEAIVDVLQGI